MNLTENSQYKSKLSVCFLVPLETAADTKSVKAAYATIRQQIVQFANAVTRNPDVLPTHAVISSDVNDFKPVAMQPVDSKIAEIQAISKLKPVEAKLNIIKDLNNDIDEKPRVVAVEWTPVEKSRTVPVVENVPNTTFDTIFKEIKKTTKSEAIINFFIENDGKELTAEEISNGTKLESTAVANWLAVTAKLPVIERFVKKVKRGTYIFKSVV